MSKNLFTRTYLGVYFPVLAKGVIVPLTSSRFLRFLALLPFLAFCIANAFAADLKPEDILSRHLEAIGAPQARTQIKSRVVQGTATYRVLVGGSGAIDGKYVFASEGMKSNSLFKINANGYLGEQFICDGNKASVAGTWSDKTRSEFGNFVLSQDIVLKENLLEGVWSAGWPLLDIEARKAKLHPEGTKKIDGKEAIAVRYRPKRSADLEIILYFDPQTYRHVATIYSVDPSVSIEGGETAQAGKSTRHYRIEERFSDFQTSDGLTLPSHYDLRYTMESENGFTKTIEWDVRAMSVANNISIDPRAFQPK